jgi:hypothetical protein
MEKSQESFTRLRTLFSFSFLILILSLGCATGPKISNIERSVGTIRKIITAVAGGEIRFMSDTQREFFSPYFSRRPDPNFDPEKSRERLYAIFTIIGERRPYEVRINTVVERRINGKYEEVGEDENITKKLVSEFQSALAQSREEKNVIDDFRSF